VEVEVEVEAEVEVEVDSSTPVVESSSAVVPMSVVSETPVLSVSVLESMVVSVLVPSAGSTSDVSAPEDSELPVREVPVVVSEEPTSELASAPVDGLPDASVTVGLDPLSEPAPPVFVEPMSLAHALQAKNATLHESRTSRSYAVSRTGTNRCGRAVAARPWAEGDAAPEARGPC